MCYKCGCSTPNDKKIAAPMILSKSGGKSEVKKPTDTKPGKYA